MKEESRRYLPAEVRNLAPRVALNSDGTFTAVDLPEREIFGPGVVVMTGDGKWRMESRSTRVCERAQCSLKRQVVAERIVAIRV